jgi:hypothetical protein
MVTKRKRRVITIVLLYLFTWVGGWISHAHNTAVKAQVMWERIDREIKEREAGFPPMKPSAVVYLYRHEGGPRTHIVAFPLLPGVLAASSEISVGRLNGSGDWQIVVFYGFGSFVLLETNVMLV